MSWGDWYKEIKCKFCHKTVWYGRTTGRIHEVGGAQMHSANCPRRRAHYSNEAAVRQQSKRAT